MALKICSVDGCDTAGPLSRGWCNMHYARWKRHGETGPASKQHATSWHGAICKQAGCNSEVKSVGYCLPHYKRFRRWGDASIRRPSTPATVRFWAKVDKSGDCWEWTAALGNHGYGVFHPSKQETELAHRWSFAHHGGELVQDYVIDHLCRNRRCVNPDHLEQVTNEENLRRGIGYRLSNGMDDSCINGHKYIEANTYRNPNNLTEVRCRECARIRDNKRNRREKAA